MEDFLVAVLQFLFEFALDVLSNLPFDLPSRNRSTPEPQGTVLPRFLWFCGGCALALGSLVVVKHTLIAVSAWRIANLVLAPLASAFLSKAISRRRTRTNPYIVPRNHFWQAFFFTLGLVLVRFAYASRT